MMNNKLKLNEEKTEFIAFGTRQQLGHLTVDSITLAGNVIKRSLSVRNLGVMMDPHLDMNVHVAHICKTSSYKIWSIWKIRRFLTTNSTKSLVHAVIISGLDYCNTLLYGIHAYLLDKLQKVQNAAARLIMHCSKFTPSKPLLKKLHWLPVKERIIYNVVLQVFKALNELSPPYIRDMLSFQTRVKVTRSTTQKLLNVPKWNNKTCAKRSFSIGGPIEWNKLPQHIRQINDIKIFKKELKTYLFKNCYDC